MIEIMNNKKQEKMLSVEDKNYLQLKNLIEGQLETFELKELIGSGSESHVYKSIIFKFKVSSIIIFCGLISR